MKWCSIQAVSVPMAAPTAKKGSSGRTSVDRIVPRLHQQSRRSAAGSVLATVLASNAQRKRPRAAAYHCPLRFSSNQRYAIAAAKQKTAESTFFVSVTQATDSTFTGCTAQTVVAAH